MTRSEIRNAVLEILQEIAGEDFEDVQDGLPFQDQLDIDSMDFLDIVMDLRKTFCINIPEEDYPQLTSMENVLTYLEPLLVDPQKVGPVAAAR